VCTSSKTKLQSVRTVSYLHISLQYVVCNFQNLTCCFGSKTSRDMFRNKKNLTTIKILVKGQSVKCKFVHVFNWTSPLEYAH